MNKIIPVKNILIPNISLFDIPVSFKLNIKQILGNNIGGQDIRPLLLYHDGIKKLVRVVNLRVERLHRTSFPLTLEIGRASCRERV